MTNEKSTKIKIMVNKTLQRKLKIERIPQTPLKTDMNSGAPKGQAVLATLVIKR